MIKNNALPSKKRKFKAKLQDRFKNTLKRKSALSKTYETLLSRGILKKGLDYCITIKITPNNIFCTLKGVEKTLILLTSGILKLKLTKRKLKFVSKIIIKKFIRNLKKIVANRTVLLTISGPVKIKKQVLKQFVKKLKSTGLIIFIKSKKSFNGCRPRKARKKKRKGFRIRA